MAILIFVIAHWYLSLFTQTFLNHRYAAHNAFEMNRFWERFFYLLAYIFQGTSYLSPRTYGIMHRMHHAYTDTERDPHSPSFDANLFSMMWRSKKIFSDIMDGSLKVEEPFLKNLPDWRALDVWGHSWPSRILWGSAYVGFYVYFATTLWLFALLPLHFIMGPFHGVIINWFAHKYGYVNFRMNNTSRNLLPFDFLMLGESYHNNHHKYPASINFGVRWHEVDPVYPLILLFGKAGLIRITHAAVKGRRADR